VASGNGDCYAWRSGANGGVVILVGKHSVTCFDFRSAWRLVDKIMEKTNV